jgi:hypothetical protein
MRRFPSGCEHYRENWTIDDDAVLYQIYCLQGTPPLTREEQEKCLASKRGCWRERKTRRNQGRETVSTTAS